MEVDPIGVCGCDRLAKIDLSVYSLEAVLKTAYRFTGKCFVHLQKNGEEVVELRLRPKKKEDDPDSAIREFLNDLVDQRLRTIIANETSAARDLIMAHALSRTSLIRPEFESASP